MIQHQTTSQGLWSKTLSEQIAQAALAEIPTDASMTLRTAAINALVERLKELREYDRWDRLQVNDVVRKENYRTVDVISVGSSVDALQVLPDGRIVSGGADAKIRIWSKNRDGTWSCELLEADKREGGNSSRGVSCLQFLSGGTIVSGVSRGGFLSVRSKNETGAWSRELVARPESVLCLQVLPDGRVVYGDEGSLCILIPGGDGSWSREVLGDAGGYMHCLQALPDGRIVTGYTESRLLIWDRGADGKWSSELVGQIQDKGTVYSLHTLPDGGIVSGCNDGRLLIWRNGGDGSWSAEELKGHKGHILCLQALPDGRIASGSWSGDRTLRIWSKGGDGKWSSELLEGHQSSLVCLQVLPDGRIVSGSSDGTIRIWDGEEVAGGAA